MPAAAQPEPVQPEPQPPGRRSWRTLGVTSTQPNPHPPGHQPRQIPGITSTQPNPHPPGHRSRWMLGVTGVALLVVSIVMMVSNAPASRAQTVQPNLAPTQLAWLQLPAPAGPYQVGTVSVHLIDRVPAEPPGSPGRRTGS